MSDIQEVHEKTTARDDNVVRSTEVTRTPGGDTDNASNIFARIIWFIAGVILVLLAFRFVFSLLGANRTNAFADFIYDVTYPLVAPFFTLFNYNPTYSGVGRFETYTLVAMVVYALIAWGLASLVTIGSRRKAV